MTGHVELRGHHLLCMLGYKGVGYTPEYSAAFAAAVEKVKNGAPILVVEGKDEACRVLCPETTPHYHCDHPKFAARDAAALESINSALNLTLRPGSVWHVEIGQLDTLRDAFQRNAIRDACTTCHFHGFCTDIANSGFEGTQFLKP